MQAAEHIFEGAFDDIVDDDGDTSMTPAGSSRVMNGTKVSGLAVRGTIMVSTKAKLIVRADTG